MSYVCQGCGTRVFPCRTDYITSPYCPECEPEFWTEGLYSNL